MHDTLRLSKFLALGGVSARRKADEIIKSGRVKVNSIKVLEPYYQVNSEIDVVTVDSKKVLLERKKYYFALNKPVNYLSDLNFSDERKLARNLIPTEAYIFPVGRLDYASEGLILFTNDGAFANRIMHPRHGVEREYVVKLKGTLTESELEAVRKGLTIEGVVARVRAISEVSRTADRNNNAWYKVVLEEGRNRIIRKIGDSIRHPVLRLKRVRIDGIKLGKLRPGTFRQLTWREIEPFRSSSD